MDERERDQMWQRIDEHSRRLQDNEQGLVELRARTEEHSRQLSETRTTIDKLNGSIEAVNASLNKMEGGMRSLRWIGIGLGTLIAIVEIVRAIGEMPV